MIRACLQIVMDRSWDLMAGSFTKIAYEAAARALAHRRAMSTLQRRLELASEIESAIESFLAFEKARLARAAQIQADLIERFAFKLSAVASAQ